MFNFYWHSASMRQIHGVTLIELMVVMAIIAILMAIGIPSFKSITYNVRVTSEINTMLGDLQFARSEAIKRGQSVTVCTSADQITCAANSAWGSGWIVFADANNDGTRNGTSEPVLRKQAGLLTNDSFTALSGTNVVSYITFNRVGFLRNSAAVTTDIKMTLQPQNVTVTDWTRCLIAGQIGSLKVSRGICP